VNLYPYFIDFHFNVDYYAGEGTISAIYYYLLIYINVDPIYYFLLPERFAVDAE